MSSGSPTNWNYSLEAMPMLEYDDLHAVDRLERELDRQTDERNNLVADLRESQREFRRLDSEISSLTAERDRLQEQVERVRGLAGECLRRGLLRDIEGTIHGRIGKRIRAIVGDGGKGSSPC